MSFSTVTKRPAPARRATHSTPATYAPEDWPTKKPARASRTHIVYDSSTPTSTRSSMSPPSRIAGTMSSGLPSGVRRPAPARVVLVDPPRHARQRAARADAADEVAQPAARLRQDLRARRLVVRAPVVRIAVLVAEEVAVGRGLEAAAALAQRLGGAGG